jgi:predicted Zn-dependent peptidase
VDKTGMLITKADKGRTAQNYKMLFLSTQILTGQYLSDMQNITPENIGRAAAKHFLNKELTLVWKSVFNSITQPEGRRIAV